MALYSASDPTVEAMTSRPGGEDVLATGVGMLSLAGSQESRFLGGSSGVTFAKMISS